MITSDLAPRETVGVLVADSNQTQSQVLCSALRRQPGLRVNCCRSGLAEILETLAGSAADVVLLMAASVPAESETFDILSRLRLEHPQMGLVLVVDAYDRELVVNAVRSGARGIFCRATEPFKALARCIATVHKGQVWVNTEQVRFLIDALAMGPSLHVVDAKGDGLLTPREEQVVALVADGATNREIGEQLSIAENTVKKLLFRIYDKLGVSRRVELVLYALAHREPYHASESPDEEQPAEQMAEACAQDVPES
jgi:DNA-binding NarL/FixJ family response regulator